MPLHWQSSALSIHDNKVNYTMNRLNNNNNPAYTPQNPPINNKQYILNPITYLAQLSKTIKKQGQPLARGTV
jgi:hypothetical protein